MLEIKTGDYKPTKKILVDGREWTMTVLGAGDELRMSQTSRRIKQLNQKIEAGTATDADYDKYDELENSMYATFKKMFRDGTPDNAEVSKWVDETPLALIQLVVEDIKKQSDEQAQNNGGQPAEQAS